MIWLLLAFVLVIVAAIVAVIVTLLKNRSEGENPQVQQLEPPQPVTDIFFTPRQRDVIYEIERLFGDLYHPSSSENDPDGLMSPFADRNSPQYKAALWLADHDELTSFPLPVDGTQDEGFVNRYVWAVFFYATGGETTWKDQCQFLSPNISVCQWQCPIPDSFHIRNENGFYAEGLMGVECLPFFWSTQFEMCKCPPHSLHPMLRSVDKGLSY